eukprot:Rhum_TRINITY_DN8789_c0_g1::Rhum_TRINITY_DN8789_c0_g1_i1::g.29873::m.29873
MAAALHDAASPEEAKRLRDAEAVLAERARQAEVSNRVLNRDADRRRTEIATLQQRLEDAARHRATLEEKVAELLAREAAAFAAGEAAAAAADAAQQQQPLQSPPPPSEAAAATSCDAGCDPHQKGFFAEEDVAEMRRRYGALEEEHSLLREQQAHDRAVDAQVRDLCEELHEEVERLQVENESLRQGLQTIETTFGRFLPGGAAGDDDGGGSDGNDFDPDAAADHDNPRLASPTPSPLRTGRLLSSKDAFAQTSHLLEQAGAGAAAAAPPPPPPPATDVSSAVREAQLEAEVALLKQQREREREAAREAFARSLREVLACVGAAATTTTTTTAASTSAIAGAEGSPPAAAATPFADGVVRVEVTYPGGHDRVCRTPRDEGLDASGGNNSNNNNNTGSEAGVLRRRSAELDAAERELEAAQALAVQLQEENADLKQHVRLLVSADPQARTVHSLLASSLRAAEKRINATLSRFKGVLRGRAALVQLLASAARGLTRLRDASGEFHVYLRRALAANPAFLAELAPRMDALSDAVDGVRGAHKTIAAEHLTAWEKQVAGMAAGGSSGGGGGGQHGGSVQAELRATEDLLDTLWVTFQIPKISSSNSGKKRET